MGLGGGGEFRLFLEKKKKKLLFSSKQKIMHNLRVRMQVHAKMENPLKLGMLVHVK